MTRTVYPTIPPRVDYELTSLGKTLLDPIQGLADWAQKHRPQVQAAQQRYGEKEEKAAKKKALSLRP